MMPVIEIRNYTSLCVDKHIYHKLAAQTDDHFGLSCNRLQFWKIALYRALRIDCASAGFPRVTGEEQITPVFSGAGLFDDRLLIITIQGLFVAQDRDKLARQAFAEVVFRTTKKWLPNDWKVEVWTESLDMDREGYVRE
jgi:hypothetical protein